MASMKNNRASLLFFCVVAIVTLFASPGIAYVGPGAGLSAIGSFIALVAAIVVAILGFLWYPLRRLTRKIKKSLHGDQDES
jgi:hypothetical protein